MKIRYEEKSNYGQPMLYILPEDAVALKAVNVLTHRKTINEDEVAALQELGHEVVQVVRAGTKIVEVTD